MLISKATSKIAEIVEVVEAVVVPTAIKKEELVTVYQPAEQTAIISPT